ncbi:nitroreductase [Variovorax ginsengisoli]|uniref:Nitroreductase n=2 Tax=Variovorax ginsengisoli TaxID=363844 RepID=A0ABT9SBT7_9BURK|nr:nitroreductase [Variovorax ginsengisoli]
MGLLEAARWAPSGLNVQPWRFVYALRGDDHWARLVASLWPGNQVWASNAAALVAITTHTLFTPPGAPAPMVNPSHAFDAGSAWAHLALQATMSGWNVHAMGGFDAAAAAAAIHLPSDHALHAIVAIGKRGDAQQLPEALQARETPSLRRPLAESVFHGAYPAVA